ncbi:MAG: hypothetical protein FD153_156 [Rhodospirillaceae bacterium]|nr:MAG: hypothetical protein FD153_156 [Rhodospirillaceae bacterium]
MSSNVHNALQAMITAVSVPSKSGAGGCPEHPVVAIARDHGAGGEIIGAMLAQRLGVRLYDRVILEKIAERLKADPDSVRALDEGVGRARELWLYRMVTGIDLSPGTYRRHLVNVILSLAKIGGVLCGRGAHVVLSSSTALRLRITGSPQVCAERIATEENVSIEEALRRIEEVNHNRGKFVWDMFQSRLNDPTQFDLVINTDRLDDHEQVVEMVVSAYQAISECRHAS